LTDSRYERCNRKILDGKELDLFFPDIKLAFEFNGIYWHNFNNKNGDIFYHRRKKEICESKDIFLMHIYEDEWTHNRHILESVIKSRLNLNAKIGARECEIKTISKREIDDFMSRNHLQGMAVSSFNYGLFKNDRLVAAMSFSKERRCVGGKKRDGVFEMVRFCNVLDVSVIGGAAKLFSHFIKKVCPNMVISYANYDKYDGSMYKTLGFKFDGKTAPGYCYVISGKRMHRYAFRKSNLVKMGYDVNKTETEIMADLGHSKIYDSGNLKFIWSRPN